MLKITIRFIFVCLCCFLPLMINANEIKWQLVDITYLSDHSIQIEKLLALLEKSKNISVKSSNNKLIIDEHNVIEMQETKEKVPPNVHSLLQEEVERLNLPDNKQKKQYFTFTTLPQQYNLNQFVLFLSDYLFLFSNDEFILTFKDKQKTLHDFSDLYNTLNTANLPLANRYFPPDEKDGFLSIPDEFNYFFKGMIDDGNLEAIKLKTYKETKLILLSSYSIAGYPKLSLISLSDDLNIIDRLEIGENDELEDGVILIKYTIDKNYLVTLNKVEYRDNKLPKLLNKTNYIINDKGKFIKVEK